MTFILSLFSDFWPYLAGAVVSLAGLWSYGSSKRRQGRNEAINEAKEADYENAADIRDRVERDHPDWVRKYDGAGFRDE